MLDRLGSHVSIALARDSVHLVMTTGWGRSSARLLGSRRQDVDSSTPLNLMGAMNELLADGQCRGLPAHVVLADDMVRYWMVEPPAQASRLADYQAAAAMRFESLFDDPQDQWVISASFESHHAFLASAMPRELHEKIVQLLVQHRMTLVSMEPEFVALWNKWRRSLRAGSWLGVWRNGSLMVGLSQGRRLCAIRPISVPVEAQQDVQLLWQQLRREAVRFNLTMPKVLGLCGSPPHAWATARGDGVICEVLSTSSDALSVLGVKS